MPLFKINADPEGGLRFDAGDLAAALAGLPRGAPVMVLIHGYRFSPARAGTDPHRHILSLTPRDGLRRAVSWPRHLGFGRGAPDEGLCIAFGWEARGSIWRAWNRAARAGAALAGLIGQIRDLRPGKVDLLAHSLGARVALAAFPASPAGSIGRVVLMAAAEFQGCAQAALRHPSGRDAEVINVLSFENDLFDRLLEALIRAPGRRDRALGAGLGRSARGWLDLRIDCEATLEALAGLGFRIPAASRRVCHWSPYLRPGLFALYTCLLRTPGQLPLSLLRRQLPDRSEQKASSAGPRIAACGPPGWHRRGGPKGSPSAG